MMLRDAVSDRKAGIAGLIGVMTTIVTVTVPLYLFDGFDWAQHDLSTLGHIDVTYNYVFNGGLVVTALFGLVFAIGLFHVEDRQAWQAGSVVYAIAHLSVIWQAVFPAGTPEHNWLSIFPFFAGALLLLGIDQVRIPQTRLWGIVILTNLFVGLLAAGLIAQTDISGWAIHETLGVTVFALVTLLYAMRMLDVAALGGDTTLEESVSKPAQ
ncbi:MAG: DUF998 domain-containing protein [Natrialbaceae archaeon]|nr:DUF998 domain-containing protein [Natrialbaceae archaeon]